MNKQLTVLTNDIFLVFDSSTKRLKSNLSVKYINSAVLEQTTALRSMQNKQQQKMISKRPI